MNMPTCDCGSKAKKKDLIISQDGSLTCQDCRRELRKNARYRLDLCITEKGYDIDFRSPYFGIASALLWENIDKMLNNNNIINNNNTKKLNR